jgi:hypothetical protein
MQYRIYKIFCCSMLLSFVGFWACSEIFEEDISRRKIRLFSPSNKVTTITQLQQFRWETISGATSYAVDIVSPSFDSIASVISNQVVTTDTLTISLPPGKYQWAVTPINSISTGRSDTFTLTVVADSTRDLRRQTVFLKSPINGLVTNSKDILFNWAKLEAAKEYRIQVAKPDFTNANNIKLDKRLILDTTSLTLAEGIYRWRVRAENDQTNTDFTEYIFTIDLTPPDVPQLVGPPIDSFATRRQTENEILYMFFKTL